MSVVSGPIAFASDGPVDDKPPTEFGGKAGLIQDHPDVVLLGSDLRGILVRGKAPVVVGLDGVGVVDGSANAVDPVTGREVDPVWNEDGSVAASAVDPLKTGNPDAGIL